MIRVRSTRVARPALSLFAVARGARAGVPAALPGINPVTTIARRTQGASLQNNLFSIGTRASLPSVPRAAEEGCVFGV